MGHKLDNVIRLYVDGIMGGNLRAALDRYVADDLIQHHPGTGDGRDGLAAAYQPLIRRYERRYVQPLRGFEDGNRVFLQTYQCFGYRDVERVNIDIIETDDSDRLVEQWSVSAPLASVSATGHSPIDGPAHIEDLAATAANRRTVTAYVEEVVVGGRATHIGRYVSATCVDHEPQTAGRPGCRTTAPGATPGGLAQLVGRGNFVATVCDVVVDGRPVAAGDLWRLDGGLIVEHWGGVQAGPLRRARTAGPRPVTTAGRTAPPREVVRAAATVPARETPRPDRRAASRRRAEPAAVR